MMHFCTFLAQVLRELGSRRWRWWCWWRSSIYRRQGKKIFIQVLR